MIPDCAAVVFHVSDLEAAIAYYTEVLGFSPDFRYGGYAGLQFGKVLLHLSDAGEQGLKRPVGGGHVCVFCDEVDDYHRDIMSKGAHVLVAPADRPYGMRDFALEDKDGNVLVFGHGIAIS
ncbi:VOC family protein [Taibaiella chishuiensis]|uniref:Putative glyoxalase superfamily protein PhnB n=1 Tax=Taibaiella chishuiensis TaxID=1434707 RepID=A0A2P8D5G8_9BACT|nr:VOC family protein [Taibaiella chishuiensis]PSK92448.1 putative glyoxalase superfamily protein PhnB [Taibaiella chishuiensis]